MKEAAGVAGAPWLDDNRRFAWIAPIAVALWAGLLAVFADLLSQTAPPLPEIKAVEARIVEMPAPAGLQSSPPAAHAPVAHTPVVAPKPVAHHVVPRRAPKHPIVPVVPPSAEGTAKAPASAATESAAPAAANSGATAGSGIGSSITGNDNSGARAIYDPAPEIPDELREEALVAVAVAHFEVDYDGHAQVTLTQPTLNPRLNDLLIETLKQWRFAPATRNGVAVASEFDIRIPVTIQ